MKSKTPAGTPAAFHDSSEIKVENKGGLKSFVGGDTKHADQKNSGCHQVDRLE
jgi:hypothetical protein